MSKDVVDYDELRRRALLDGEQANQSKDALAEKFLKDGEVLDDEVEGNPDAGDGRNPVIADGGAAEADRHPEGQDAEDGVDDDDQPDSVEDHFDDALEGDVDDLDPTHPTKRLREARKQIGLALDELVDATKDQSRIELWTRDGREALLNVTDERVYIIERPVGDDYGPDEVDSVRVDRADALLASTCLRVLALDIR